MSAFLPKGTDCQPWRAARWPTATCSGLWDAWVRKGWIVPAEATANSLNPFCYHDLRLHKAAANYMVHLSPTTVFDVQTLATYAIFLAS